MSFNNVGHLITSTITTLQHFATLNHTSPNYTSLHISTLHFLPFGLTHLLLVSMMLLTPLSGRTLRPYLKTFCYVAIIYGKRKGKAVPLQAWSGPEGSRKLRFPDFMTTAQDGGKVVSSTHRSPLPPRKYTWYSFLLGSGVA